MTDDTAPHRGQPVLSDLCSEIVITAEDRAWVTGFARALVDQRLAACVHVVAEIEAIYRWDGAIHDDDQVRIAVHTRSTLVPAIVAKTDAEHPDLVPCVIAMPISSGHPAYLRWIHKETVDPGAGPAAG